MEDQIHEDQTFENVDYSEKKFPKTEFNYCDFINCNFSKSDLTNSSFMDCSFKGCNLSLAILNNTAIKSLSFLKCKLTGIDFSVCNEFLFAASFDNCQLDYSSF